MEIYEVGKIYPRMKGQQEGCRFDITDEGAILTVCFDRPTQEETDAFGQGERLEIRLLELSDVMMFLFRPGALNWMEAPYNPHLSRNLTGIRHGKGMGLAVTLMLFDSSSGKLEAARLISLSERMTDRIRKACRELMGKPFDPADYDAMLSSVFRRYSTDDLAKMAGSGFRTS